MTQEISIFDSAIRYNDRRIMDHLATGLERGGIRVKRNESCRNIAVWGWPRGQMHRKYGGNVLVLERAYLGDRLKDWLSLGWNGLNGRADFCVPKNPTLERFQKHFTLKPWKTGGDKIIIMGQIYRDASLNGKDLTSWYEQIVRDLEKAHGLPVFFRDHPHVSATRRNFNPRIARFKGTLEDALAQAACVVTYNSNTAVDAVVNGVPAMSFDEGSMAYAVTSHDATKIIRPDRDAWAARLAWCQMTPAELASGDWVERFFAGR